MEQGSVLRRIDPKGEKYEEASQSLWNRAVSYDEKGMIAFELMKSQSLWNRAVSYDLHGDVHPQINARSQSLWNRAVSYDLLQKIKNLSLLNVSIPLEQGSVLRQNYQILSVTDKKSQSLWNRAVSYDKPSVSDIRMLRMSQSLWNRAVSYDLGHFLRKRTF